MEFILKFLEQWEAGNVILIDGVYYAPLEELCEVLLEALVRAWKFSQLVTGVTLGFLFLSVILARIGYFAFSNWKKRKEERKDT